MHHDDPHRGERHARKRRLKQLLRFVPRRAVFHRYPLVGRFAKVARRRAYLWSFKPAHVRPAIYLGCVLAFWPVMGVQLILAFVAALMMRANVMVAGALQFITNPVTAAPLYFATYLVGKYVMRMAGYTAEDPQAPDSDDVITVAIPASDAMPHGFDWTSAFGTTVMALFIGGTLMGLVLGVLLDLIYVSAWKFDHRKARPHRKAHPKPGPKDAGSPSP